MENRPNLHYQRNTVKLPSPSRHRLKKNWSARVGRIVPTGRHISHEPKVCASYRCVWCGYKSQSDNPIIICPRCHNCQYCGQYQGAGYDHECLRCGNHLPKED